MPTTRTEAPSSGEGTARDPLEIAGRSFESRLITGTGKYEDREVMLEALRAADPAMVTVAVRRVDLGGRHEESILSHLDPEEFFLLPNTAGCHTAEEAMRYARLAREAGVGDWVKLEVVGDEETLFPDVEETLKAASALSAEGFTVLAYTNDDLVTALKLEEAGVAAVMPLASPIGSGLGLLNPVNVRILKRRLEVPVIVDAGVGTASDACETMEQGVDGVLMNTAIADADRPVMMAAAMRRAVEAGRMAYRAGRMPRREWAVPSSPSSGMLD
jgi:thiazole synthase